MPNMVQTKSYSIHDLPATDAFESFQSKSEGPPSGISFLHDQTSGGYMVFPSRARAQVANYVNGVASSTSEASPKVVWSVLTTEGDSDISTCVGSEKHFEGLIQNKSQQIIAPASNSNSTLYPSHYVGPRWSVSRGPKIVTPVDNSDTEENPEETPAPDNQDGTEEEATADDFSTSIATQESICQDVWWTIETTSLSSNETGMPFYVQVKMPRPLASNQPTFFALRVGNLSQSSQESEPKDVIDLVFVEGGSAMLYDLGMIVEKSDEDGKKWTEPASVQLPQNIAWDGNVHTIEFVPLAGRLCISIDGWDYLYTRVDAAASGNSSGGTGDNPALTKGTLLFFIEYKQIRAIGSNSMADISLGSVIFPLKTTLPTMMPGGFNPMTNSSDIDLSGSESGLNDDPKDVAMVQLPDNRNETTILGAFAKTSDGKNLTADDFWGSAASDHMHGEVNMLLVDNAKGKTTKNAPSSKHYVIQLVSEKSEFGDAKAENKKRPTLCPVWFRARGVSSADTKKPTSPPAIVVDDDIIELNQSFTSPDRYHITHSVDLILYNEGGQYDSLCEKSSAIQVGFAWEGQDNGLGSVDMGVGASGDVESVIFTGVVLNGSKILSAGKELVSLHCEDYMFILEATLVINSPYYDGMDGFNIVYDMASKANITAEDDTGGGEGERFFVPSGYSFLEPVKRYDPKSSVKECILDVCSMGSKVVFFDGDGILHYSHIQGGVGFTTPADGIDAATSYISDPDGASDKELILDEKRTEVKLNSVVNNIFIKSVDKTQRAIIMMNDMAELDEDILSYKKIMYASMPALGSFAAVAEQIERLKTRVYKPIRGITIKTADDLPLFPMTFMKVDGDMYRIMGVSRSIRVDDNSISTSITGEWMGSH